MEDIDETSIYKNALMKIAELDSKMHNSVFNTGFYTAVDSIKYFSDAVSIARDAISEGLMKRHANKSTTHDPKEVSRQLERRNSEKEGEI